MGEEVKSEVVAKIYTLDEVAKHNTAQDCWLIIDGKVYDVTRFLDEHPGGDEVMLSVTGIDATDDFEDVGHSTGARMQLADYLIGDFDQSTAKARTLKEDGIVRRKSSSTSFVNKILQFLVPVAILSLAVAVRYLTKNDPIAAS
eukprot:jgi/Mesen1/8269/ME000448S07420